MSGLPTLVKTWQLAHTTILTQGSSTLNMQHTMRVGLVNALLGLATNPPVVKGSSDGTTAAMDNTNRWTTDAKLVWAATGTNHSWIVLQFAPGWQMLIDLNATSIGTLTVSVSASAGFTGGSITTAPVASDSWSSPFNGAWTNTTSDTQRIAHIWMPTDGSAFRALVYKANLLESFFQYETPISTTTGWTGPMVGVGLSLSLLQKPTFSDVAGGAFAYQGKGPNTPFFMSFELTAEGSGSSGAVCQIQTTANGIDGSWPFSTIGIYSNTSNNVGLHGRLVDCWFGSVTRNTGDMYPLTGASQFVTIGNFIWPWDGTATLVVA